MRHRSIVRSVLSAAVLLAVSACSGGSGPLKVTGAWARSSASGQTSAAVYFRLRGGEDDDQLIGVSVPRSIAASATLHESMGSMGSMPDMPGMDHSSMDMGSMEPIEQVEVGAGETVEFRPGGKHVMLEGLSGPLQAGSTFELTLRFRDRSPIDLMVEVSDDAPST